MKTLLERLNPAVPRGVLPVVAGTIYGAMGLVLIGRAAGWLSAAPAGRAALFGLGGLVLGAVMIRMAFLPLVRKNLARLEGRPARACLFSMYPWRTWAIALVMSAGGVTLRQSDVPRLPLATGYLAMGLSLLAGAWAYARFIRSRRAA